MYNLNQLGWNDFFEDQFKLLQNQKFIPARVAVENKQRYILYSSYGELSGEVTGKLLFASDTTAQLPKTGDWVSGILYEDEKKLIIHSVFQRKTKISRKAAGRTFDEQVIASNIDYVFIVQSLDNNYNLRRLERYLTSVYESTARPVIVLNKIDLAENLSDIKQEVKNCFEDAEIIFSDAVKGYGLDAVKSILTEGKTGVFIGSSGVGKSTIINNLCSNANFKTNEISSAVNKGRHTTTRREMVIIPSGGIIIDTPGMRELQLWNSEKGVSSSFSEIESLALKCKFRDCSHNKETGCAVTDAVKKGILSVEVLNSYNKLKKELEYLKIKTDKKAFLERKEKAKKLNKEIKKIFKKRNY